MLESVFKGWIGELKTKAAEWLLLDSSIYHVFNDVLISANQRTTQIDHVIVSKYGVFVTFSPKTDPSRVGVNLVD
jgi:restriction system protein